MVLDFECDKSNSIRTEQDHEQSNGISVEGRQFGFKSLIFIRTNEPLARE